MSTDLPLHFANRDSTDYCEILAALLSLQTKTDGLAPGLLETSVGIDSEKAAELFGSDHAHIRRVINIDLLALSGTVLLDSEGRHRPSGPGQYGKLKKLVEETQRLNQEGTAVRIRCLLQYPYSMAGQNRILAETWDQRAFIDGPTRRKEWEWVPPLDEANIDVSRFKLDQAYCITNFARLLQNDDGEIPSLHPVRQEPNRLEMRFACINTMLCGIRVNGCFFYDVYNYARMSGEPFCAAHLTPIHGVYKASPSTEKQFDVFCNHFQYIWQCDSTLDYGDVVKETCPPFEPPRKGFRRLTSVVVQKPAKVEGSSKRARLEELTAKHETELPAGFWERCQTLLTRLVTNVCPMVRSVPANEVGFIVGPWVTDKDGRSDLCPPAKQLFDWLMKHFGRKEEESFEQEFKVEVVNAALGENIHEEVFTRLNRATFGIVVLTKGYKDGTCPPNVYTEMGYLLRKNGRGRTFIILDDMVSVGSDLETLVRGSLDQKNLRSVYIDVVKALLGKGIVTGDAARRAIADVSGL